MRSLVASSGYIVILSVLATAIGCTAGERDRFPISGTITYNDVPVPEGWIEFQPDSTKGNEGQTIVFSISDGQYGTSYNQMRHHQGGPHLVQIDGYDGLAGAEGESSLGSPLFRGYETSVDLPEAEATDIDFAIEGSR